MNSRLSGLHLQLLGLIIVPLSAVLLAVAVTGVSIHQDAMKRLIAERDVRGARAAAAAIGQNLTHLQNSVRALAQRHQAAGSEAPSILDQQLMNEFDAGYLVLDPSGETLAASEPPPFWRQAQAVVGGYDPGAVAVETLLEDGNVIVLVIAAEPDATAIGAFTVQTLARAALLSSMVTSETSSVFLVDSSGTLIYAVGERPSAGDLLQHPGVPEGLRGESGSTFRDTEGGERAVAFSAIPESDWALIFEEPWREVTSPLLDLSLLAPLALVPVLVVTVVGLWFGARQVIQPLRKLREQAEQVALVPGSFGEPFSGGIAEIRLLAGSLAQMAERVSSSQRSLQRYIGAITSAQEDERSRLARELHDETIQGLIAIDQRIQMLTMEAQERDGELLAPLQTLHADVTRAVAELRRMARALRPLYLEDLGLVPAVEMLTQEFDRASEIAIEFESSGKPLRLEAQAELAVYRVIQEALSNVVRHARAKTARVRIDFSAANLRASVRDDGVGFSAPDHAAAFVSAGHFGLMNMRERADLIDAQLAISSSAGGGTEVRLELELPPQGDRQTA